MKLRQKLYISAALLALAMPVHAANTNLSLYINNTIINQSDYLGRAYIVPSVNRTMIPTRLASESMGFKIDWDNDTKVATISNDKNTVVLTLGEKTALVNGKPATLDSPVEFKNGRIYIPMRFVGEALGCTVEYKAANKAVYITTSGNVSKPSTPSTPTTGFVGMSNMVKGQSYNIDQVVTDRVAKDNTYSVYSSNILDSTKVTFNYGGFGSSTNGLTIKNFGWADSDKYSGALAFSGTVDVTKFDVLYFKNNKLLAVEAVTKLRNGYGLFGDQFLTPTNFANADKIGFAKRGSGEILIIDKPSTMVNLDIYKK